MPVLFVSSQQTLSASALHLSSPVLSVRSSSPPAAAGTEPGCSRGALPCRTPGTLSTAPRAPSSRRHSPAPNSPEKPLRSKMHSPGKLIFCLRLFCFVLPENTEHFQRLTLAPKSVFPPPPLTPIQDQKQTNNNNKKQQQKNMLS